MPILSRSSLHFGTPAQRETWLIAILRCVKSPGTLVALSLAVLSVLLAGCRKDVAAEASDSDANGYVCLSCEAKFYTDRSVFIGPKCPKCQKDTLMEVVGYYCEKDKHITLRARTGDRQGAPVCEQCQAPLNAMRLPRAAELKAWGATKTS